MKNNLGVFKYFAVSVGVILVDQVVKILVHQHMRLGVGGQIKIFGDWFKLHYLTNAGMAFGMELPFEHAKIILTLFRLFAMIGIGYYMVVMYKKDMPKGFLICVGMILGGAVGNLIDSVFYGYFLENVPFDAPTPWFFGQVIDMFYIDIWEGRLPDWIPFLGGDYMSLWPVFNVADAAIFTSVCIILTWQKTFFEKEIAADSDENQASPLKSE